MEKQIDGFTMNLWEKHGLRRIYIHGNGIKHSLGYYFDLNKNEFAPYPRGRKVLNDTAIVEKFLSQQSGGYPVSLEEIGQDDPAVRTSIRIEMHRSNLCPDCGHPMEQDGGQPYCEYCEG